MNPHRPSPMQEEMLALEAAGVARFLEWLPHQGARITNELGDPIRDGTLGRLFARFIAARRETIEQAKRSFSPIPTRKRMRR